jgi:tRNA(Glu) U13 pseudouridine synthase TruD
MMHLSENELQGPIPVSIFKIRGLNVLGLSSNQFNGTINFEMIKDTNELTTLDLSGNNFSFEVSGVNSTLFSHIGKKFLNGFGN